MWQPKGHFEKFLEATCPNHSYPIKHKLKDCTKVKKFVRSWAFSNGRNLGGKGMTPNPGEAGVMAIFD
jgi:hypothetical protein